MSARRSFALVAAFAIVIAWLFGAGRVPPTRVVFLSVGQGDATLLQSGGRSVLIDCGPESAGRRILPRSLRKFGVREIDMLLLTHPDSDHIAGLPALSRRYRIRRIGVPKHFEGHPNLVAALQDANLKDSVDYIASDVSLAVGEFDLRIVVTPWSDSLPENEGSLAVRISSGGAMATLTGDAGTLQEVELMRAGNWSAQLLKLGHHGSRFSSSDSWLDHVKPTLAVASCGVDNSYGHPARDTLDRCERRRIAVSRTDLEGDIVFAPEAGHWVRH